MYSAKYGRLLGIAEENYQLLQEFMEIYVHGNPGDYPTWPSGARGNEQ